MKKGILLSLFCILIVSYCSAVTPEGPATGFRGEFLGQLQEVEKKTVDLAEAIPAEKYSWRPGEGIRSVSEVYMHIAGGNYLLLQFIGVQPPPGISRDMEKITEKAKVIENLKQSYEFVRQAVVKMPDSELEKKVKFFSGETTVRDVLFNVALHMHEHMGQLIAYARINGIVPPWTAAAEQPTPKK